MNLKGRNFLTLKDFTKEEIQYLVSLAAELKAKKKQGVLVDTLRGKNIALIFEKPVPEPDVPLKPLLMTLEWVLLIWTQRVLRLEKKRVSKILQECLEEFMMELSIVAMARKRWKRWQNMQGYRYGMA